jgi:hypothetical protein
MGKRRWLAAGGSVLAATVGLLGAGTAASASTASPVVGYTYIDGNTATANTIDGFARHADGSVTPLPGSPFAAGGAGTGSGLASQGAIQATPGGRYLLAVDAGSNQISVLRITRDGAAYYAGGVKAVIAAPAPPGPRRTRGWWQWLPGFRLGANVGLPRSPPWTAMPRVLE